MSGVEEFDDLESLDDLDILEEEPVKSKTEKPTKPKKVEEHKKETKDIVDEEEKDNINPNLDDLDDLEWDELSEDDLSAEQKDRPSDLEKSPNLSEKDKKLLERYQDLDVDDEEEEKEMVSLREDRRKFSERLERDSKFRSKYIESEKNRRENLKDDEDDVTDIISRLQDGKYENPTSAKSNEDRLKDLEAADSEVERELDDLEDVEEIRNLGDIVMIKSKKSKSSGSSGNTGNDGSTSEGVTIIKPGLFIQNVKNLTINLTIT